MIQRQFVSIFTMSDTEFSREQHHLKRSEFVFQKAIGSFQFFHHTVAGQTHRERAQALGEDNLLIVCDVLIMEDKHRVVVKGVAKLCEPLGIDRLSDVNAVNLHADVLRQFADCEAHG